MFLLLLAALSNVDQSQTRGGRDRRRRLLAHLLQDRAAGDLAGDGDRHPDPRPRPGPHLRHHLGADRRRARHDDRDDLDLHLRPGLLSSSRPATPRRSRSWSSCCSRSSSPWRSSAWSWRDEQRCRASRAQAAASGWRCAIVAAVVADRCLPVSDLLAVHDLVQDAGRDLRLPAGLVSPDSIQFANYCVLFKDGDVLAIWNSLVVAGVSTVHRDVPRHASAPTAWRASRPAARTSRSGSSRSA